MSNLAQRIGQEFKTLRSEVSSSLTEKPVISISASVNESSDAVGTITNYDSAAAYTFSDNVTYSSGNTFTYNAGDITDGNDDIDTITVYATKAGELRSELASSPITIVYVPIVADDAYQVVDFTGQASFNDGFEEIA